MAFNCLPLLELTNVLYVQTFEEEDDDGMKLLERRRTEEAKALVARKRTRPQKNETWT